MDRLDRKILALLQEDATLPVTDVARQVGLSTTPCWRRIQKMEEDGVIKERVAILDPEKINAGITIFVSINTSTHSVEWLDDFSRHVTSLSEIVEVYRMSGDVDYLLRVLVPNMSAIDAFHKRLVSKLDIRTVSLSLRSRRSSMRRSCHSSICSSPARGTPDRQRPNAKTDKASICATDEVADRSVQSRSKKH